MGTGVGTVEEELPALFSSSELVRLRLQLPFGLEALPDQGVMRVTKDGSGLHAGDVVRAFTTYAMPDVPKNMPLLQALQRRRRPARCLFLADGQPAPKVVEALMDNTPERTSEIVLFVERQRHDGGHAA